MTVLGYLLIPLSLAFTVDNQGNFRDEHNRTVLFHGVNAVVKLPPYVPSTDAFDPIMSISDEDITFMKQTGVNIVRLGVIWEAVEPQLKSYNATYLDQVEKVVNKLGESGITTIIDCHQDLLSRFFCGEGMPPFYVPEVEHSCADHVLSSLMAMFDQCKSMESYGFTYDENNFPHLDQCQSHSFIKYFLSPEINSLWNQFYTNSTITDAFGQYWATLADKFANNQYVIGYDILNEPWPGNLFANVLMFVPKHLDYLYLQPLYDQLSPIIRSKSPNKLLFFEPAQFPDTFAIDGGLVFSVGFTKTPGDAPLQSILNDHTYCCQVSEQMCLDKEPTVDEAKGVCRDFHKRRVKQRREDARSLGTGLFFSEFGACSNSEGCVEEIRGATDAFDENLSSWTYWQYKWFNDFTTTSNSAESLFYNNGTTQDLKLQALRRTYVQAWQGSPYSMRFNDTTKEFFTAFEADCSIPEYTEIYIDDAVNYNGGYNIKVNSTIAFDVQHEPNKIIVKCAQGSGYAELSLFRQQQLTQIVQNKMDYSWLTYYAQRRTARPYSTVTPYTIPCLQRYYPQFPVRHDFWDSVTSSCLFTVSIAGIGGYVLGLAFGFVFSHMEQNNVDNTLRFSSQVKQVYKGVWTRMVSQAKAFSTFGALYVALECPLETFRGCHDTWNSLIAGSITGGMFAVIGRSGLRATLGAGISCGFFCFLIDSYMNR